MKKPPSDLPLKKGEVYAGSFWEAYGCSWQGNPTKRDGKRVRCGHKHRSAKAAHACRAKMRETRPGNCQDYRIHEIHLVSKSRRG